MKISKYNERPLFSNANASYNPEVGVSATIYLDIEKEIIKDFSYEQKGLDNFVPSFSMLGEKIIGKNLSEIRELSFGEELVNLPLKMLNQALTKFTGQTYRFELLNEKIESLICRCFGVYKGQILEALKVGSPDLISILDETGATGGCGSCLGDVKNIVREFHGERILIIPKVERVLGMSPVELHLKIDGIIKDFDKQNVVLGIKNNLILLKINSKELKEHLNATFGDDLLFSFQS